MIENKESSWREFQAEYISERKKREQETRILKWGVVVCIFILIFGPLAYKFINSSKDDLRFFKPALELKQEPEEKPEVSFQLTRKQLAPIIDQDQLAHTDKNIFFIDTPEYSYKVTTSIDVYLQEFLISVLQRLKKLTRGKPQRIAFVVIEAETGKILAMTGFDLDNIKKNPCMYADYPAASIFKIVTAAAAVEKLGFNASTPLFFNGNKYTLYKRQLKDVKNKYTYKISFSSAFAQSVNPVFGKIGKNRLGKNGLESYATAFGFNNTVESELSFYSGNFKTNESEYYLAELGSGFNTDTTISPLFGAMLTSAIINSGNIMVPSIVEHVTDSEGKVIYKNKKETYKTAITPGTANTMIPLMQKTVTHGTARKSFRGTSRDKVLSSLIIGGKTGSLYNKEHTVKYDWFTGFGQDKTTQKKIALAIVVGHRKYIGTRASTYAKMILKQYFKPKTETAQLLNASTGG